MADGEKNKENVFLLSSVEVNDLSMKQSTPGFFSYVFVKNEPDQVIHSYPQPLESGRTGLCTYLLDRSFLTNVSARQEETGICPNKTLRFPHSIQNLNNRSSYIYLKINLFYKHWMKESNIIFLGHCTAIIFSYEPHCFCLLSILKLLLPVLLST